MACRKAKYLIEDVREEVLDQGASGSEGMPDSSYLLHLNDALSRIYSLIIGTHPKIFTKEVSVDVNRDTEVIDIPVDAFMGNKILDVKYSSNGQYFSNLPLLDRSRDRAKGDFSSLIGYYRESGKIRLIGRPDANGIVKYVYVKKIPKLAFKIGNFSRTALETLIARNRAEKRPLEFLPLNSLTNEVNTEAIRRNTRLTIVDFEGNIKLQNIGYTEYNTGNGFLRLKEAIPYDVAVTIDPSDIIIPGPYSSDTPLIDDYVEKYLISYATMKMLQRDDSSEIANQTKVLMEMEQEIVSAYATVSDDIQFVPDINQSVDWSRGG